MQSLQNKIAFITGASSGIGKACAEHLAESGVNVILTARRLDRIEATATELTSKFGVKALALPLDVSDRDAVDAAVAGLPSEFAHIDILVNNAGLALSTDPIQDADPANWDCMIDTNVKGLLYVFNAVIKGMVEQNRGHVVNISSIAGHETYTLGNVYCATKHAVRALSKGMRLDLNGTAIRVTDIAPGAAETEFSKVRWGDDAKADAFYADFEPLVADDIADAVVYATSRRPHVNISEMVIYPTAQASPSLIKRS